MLLINSIDKFLLLFKFLFNSNFLLYEKELIRYLIIIYWKLNILGKINCII